MDRFIELTSTRHNCKIIVNVHHIAMVLPAHIGSDVFMQGIEDRPLAVTEEYQKLKDMLVARKSQ